MIRYSKLIFLILIIAIIIPSCLSRDVHEINRIRGQLIINAIYEYKEENSQFPNSLDDLVPIYLESIPPALRGYDFYYRTNSVDGFVLTYQISSDFGCGFTSKVQSWGCGWGAE